MVQLSRELAGQTLVENAGFSRKPGRRVSPLELGEGARDCPLHDTRERERLSFENVKRRGWIKGGGKATRTPSLSLTVQFESRGKASRPRFAAVWRRDGLLTARQMAVTVMA